MKVVKAKSKTWKRKSQNTLNTISIVYFRYARLFTAKYSRTSTIYPVIFEHYARMNTIASRDQFKPIRIGENLVVNYDIS